MIILTRKYQELQFLAAIADHLCSKFLRITKLRRMLKKKNRWFVSFMKAESEFYKEVSGVGVGRQIGDLGFLRKATKVLLCTSASVHIFHFQESS